MSLRNKQLADISEADLQALIEDEVPEGKEIEYKEQLPGNSPDEKKEFLADVSSFANCMGGDLLFGIRDERDEQRRPTGTPSALVGVGVANLDAEKLRLENLIRDGVEPRIVGLTIRPVALANSGQVIVVRIPKSWISPHMVTYQGSSKFFSRNSAGKYQLDVSEIRSAFLSTEAIGQRLRNFRADRLAQIESNQGPVVLPDTAKIVLHLVPFQAFEVGVQFDLSQLANEPTKLRHIYQGSSHSHRYNFDGVLGYCQQSYLQVFRNGIIEAVDLFLLSEARNQRYIPGADYERYLIQAVRHYLGLQQELGVDPPLALMLTLLGVKGYKMGVEWRLPEGGAQPIDRDQLIVPEVLIKEYSPDTAQLLRPCFDQISNAAGFPRSMNYNENRERVSD